MNYSEVVALALSYSDREDKEVHDNMDNFLRVAEARINRALKVQKMSMRTQISTKKDKEYYGLPEDFAGLRDIKVFSESSPKSRTTLSYLSPEQMNAESGKDTSYIYYAMVANQLQVMPPQNNKIIEIVYYRKVPALNGIMETNWISVYNPDLYLYGLMVEINSFTKDAEAKLLWDDRFVGALSEIKTDDQETRWSGPTLQTRLG